MSKQIKLGDIVADVTLKNIKNVHLSVYPPHGAVRISAPKHMNLDTIRVFALSKLVWIKKNQQKIKDQERETKRDFINRESHYFWGNRYLLKISEKNEKPLVVLKHRKMHLQVRPGTDEEKRGKILEAWYRQELKESISPIIEKWEKIIGVKSNRFIIQKMKTKWGSCTPKTGIIRLNLELVKKPPECLEYIIVHELIHLIERTHNARFIALMDKFMPKWRFYRDELNRLPVAHESWKY